MNNRFIGLFLLFKTNKMNGHFVGFQILVQKLEWITPIISTLQDKQKEWSLYRVSLIDSKVRTFLVYGQLSFIAEYGWIFDTWHAICREMISSASQVYAMFSSLGSWCSHIFETQEMLAVKRTDKKITALLFFHKQIWLWTSSCETYAKQK